MCNSDMDDTGTNSADGGSRFSVSYINGGQYLHILRRSTVHGDNSKLVIILNADYAVYLLTPSPSLTDNSQEITFLLWLKRVWSTGSNSEFLSWCGVLPTLDRQVSAEESENKRVFGMCLELYCHLCHCADRKDLCNNGTFMKCFMELVLSDVVAASPYLSLDHFHMLGLYILLRYKGSLLQRHGYVYTHYSGPTGSGDIILEFLRAVDMYFSAKLYWSYLNISSDVATACLWTNYSAVMEMYFHIKCAMESGLYILCSRSGCWRTIMATLRDKSGVGLQ
mmetsp:Transcript_1280/g.2083  ORF Transcript_1280/g.2083 Transcript_1280/m.2083 type:complete len:280 (-) Transcript_1280:238-1077(-)